MTIFLLLQGFPGPLGYTGDGGRPGPLVSKKKTNFSISVYLAKYAG